MITLRQHLENWQRFGGYLNGVTSIARAIPDLTIDSLLSAMRTQNYMGCHAESSIRTAFAAARAQA